jgi:hypothetical protein
MSRQIDLRSKDAQGADERRLIDLPPGKLVGADFNSGLPVAQAGADVLRALLHDQALPFTDFALLPAAAVATGSDKLILISGTGTEVIARSATGGVNLKSQATTPADGDNIIGVAVSTTAFNAPITAASLIWFATQVSIGATGFATCFASFGLNENLTDVDPTGTAGEGAMFLYDPTVEVTTGLATAAHANWILCHKVNGTDTFTATDIPVVAGQLYDLDIKIGSDLKAKFYIDGNYVGQGPALTSGDTVGVFTGAELTATPDGQVDYDCKSIMLARTVV